MAQIPTPRPRIGRSTGVQHLAAFDRSALRVGARMAAVVVCLLVAVVGEAGAQDDNIAPISVVFEVAALDAIDFDPWTIQAGVIPDRRLPIISYQAQTSAAAAATGEARAEAESRLLDLEAVLDAAAAHRADMEEEVEGFSISMWLLGDLGLQEVYGSEAERARQAQPVIAVTDSMIERVEAADAALAVATTDVEAALVVLTERIAADDAAKRLARDAKQIRERFESMVVARSEAIDRWTHDVLTEEAADVTLVAVTSVTVQVPIGLPDDRGASNADEIVQAATSAESSGEATDDQGQVLEPVPTTATTVAIPPIVVNAEIAGQVRALIGAARSDGINLHGGGHRPREDQITLRFAHCGTSGYDVFERPAGECSPPTARPGKSQHELGLAVDFTENGAILTWGSPGFEWMVANAGAYGLINLPSEAWHWSTTGG